MRSRHNALLVFADGRVFRGRTYGATGRTLGTATFRTIVTGYQELFTNPDIAGKIIVMAAPHIGNTGVNPEFSTSDTYQLAGVVVRDPARRASHWQSRGELEDDLVGAGIVGICEVDTRAIVRHLRDNCENHESPAGIFSGESLPAGAYEGDDEAISQLVDIVCRESGKDVL